MKYGCPNSTCKYHLRKDFVIPDGTYKRANDSRIIRRLKCKSCKKRFSYATHSLAYRQKKRRINHQLMGLLSSRMSMRRAALHLNIHRTTVKRKLIYLAKKAQLSQEKFLESLKNKKVQHIQFDDLITIEHTKLKPLSITLAVDVSKRKILAVEICQIPSFGHLATLSKRKYGFRKSFHKKSLDSFFYKLKDIVDPNAKIESDEHKLYSPMIRKYFPQSNYLQYKGGRGCVAGQGELKKLNYDPLFAINHTCAMLRANINRLIRKTWCTTKDPKMLERHLQIYLHYHNEFLVR